MYGTSHDYAVDLRNRPRMFTDQHAHLLEVFSESEDEQWSRRALRSCLEHLAVSTTTEAWSVEVEEAWVEGPWTFCVVYRYHYYDGRLGLRRTSLDAEHDGRFVDMYGDDRATVPDPVRFGQDVADFDIGEPLGSVIDGLQQAEDGTHWWGSPADA